MRTSTLVVLAVSACAYAAPAPIRRDLGCAPATKSGLPFTVARLVPDDVGGADDLECIYNNQAACVYFENGNFSSGSSDCPPSLAQGGVTAGGGGGDSGSSSSATPPPPPASTAAPPPPPPSSSAAPPPPPPSSTSTKATTKSRTNTSTSTKQTSTSSTVDDTSSSASVSASSASVSSVASSSVAASSVAPSSVAPSSLASPVPLSELPASARFSIDVTRPAPTPTAEPATSIDAAVNNAGASTTTNVIVATVPGSAADQTASASASNGVLPMSRGSGWLVAVGAVLVGMLAL